MVEPVTASAATGASPTPAHRGSSLLQSDSNASHWSIHNQLTSRASSHNGTATVVALNVPQGFTVGIDAVAFTSTTAPFRGLRNVPHGAHLLWVSESDAGLAARSGVWFDVPDSGETVVVVKWDGVGGALCRANLAEERAQAAEMAAAPGRMAELLPYLELARQSAALRAGSAEDNVQAWRNVSGFVTSRVLARVMGSPTGPWQAHTTDRVRGAHMLPSEIELENQLAGTPFSSSSSPPSCLVAAQELRFAFSQTERTFDMAAVGAERTAAAIDPSAHVLARMGEAELGDGDVVGEMQLAFIMGAHLGNEACVRQWRHFILRILLRAFGLVGERPLLVAELLTALGAQLRYADSNLSSVADLGLDASESAAAAQIRTAVSVFKRRMESALVALGREASPAHARVGTAFQSVEAAAVRLGWDLRSGEGERMGGVDGHGVLRKGAVTLEDGETVELEMDRVLEEDEENEEGEYAPVAVELDEEGRERGMISWGD